MDGEGSGGSGAGGSERLALMREYHLALRAWVAGEIGYDEMQEVSERWFDYLNARREDAVGRLPPLFSDDEEEARIRSRAVIRGGGDSGSTSLDVYRAGRN